MKITIEKGKVYRYLALGDSYTKGESVKEEESFPMVLSRKIEDHYGIVVTNKIIATTGWRTDELLGAIEKEPLQENYNFVSLLIGVNNQYQRKAFEQYKEDFVVLLDVALKLVGGNAKAIVVVSIPDYAYTPMGKGDNAVSMEIDNYNNYAKKIATLKNVDFLNITDITRKGLEDPTLVATDNLHISEKVYQQIAQRIFNLKF